MDPLNTLRAEGPVILAAPWSFAICVLIADDWAVVHFLNKQHIKNLKVTASTPRR